MRNATTSSQAIPILPAEDLATGKDFYVNELGSRLTFEASEDGHAGIVGLERGTMRITLNSPMDGHGRNACVCLPVANADAYYREWSAKVNVLRAPRDEEWGARTFDLLDPSGNTIFIMGPVSGSITMTASEAVTQGRQARKDGNFAVARAHYAEAARMYRDENEALAYAHTIRHIADIYRQNPILSKRSPCMKRLWISIAAISVGTFSTSRIHSDHTRF